jgi:ESS family glutamate:Na+ symporter
MTGLARQPGAVHRAFILLPLVSGFFIDQVNTAVISYFVNL